MESQERSGQGQIELNTGLLRAVWHYMRFAQGLFGTKQPAGGVNVLALKLKLLTPPCVVL